VNEVKRESYRFESDAMKARDRWLKRGSKAYIDYAKIGKYIVIIE